MMTYKTAQDGEGALVMDGMPASAFKECPNFRACGAPLCPMNAASLVEACWQAGEELCSRRDFQALPWMKLLRKLVRRKKNLVDGYFTVEMLTRMRAVSRATEGLDPDHPERLAAWLKAHPTPKARKTRKWTDAERKAVGDRLHSALYSSKKVIPQAQKTLSAERTADDRVALDLTTPKGLDGKRHASPEHSYAMPQHENASPRGVVGEGGSEGGEGRGGLKMAENAPRKIIVQCCVCQRVRIGAQDDPNAAWVEKKDAGLTGGEEASHTYCPACAESARRELVGDGLKDARSEG